MQLKYLVLDFVNYLGAESVLSLMGQSINKASGRANYECFPKPNVK